MEVHFFLLRRVSPYPRFVHRGGRIPGLYPLLVQAVTTHVHFCHVLAGKADGSGAAGRVSWAFPSLLLAPPLMALIKARMRLLR